jgi:hypothetical protein
MSYTTKPNELRRCAESGANPNCGLGPLRHVIAVIGLCALFGPVANADCGSAAAKGAVLGQTLPGNVFTLPPDPAVQGNTEEQARSDSGEEHNFSRSIVGFWKTTFTSGGVVVDVGFDQFHPDGTENSVDSPAPSFGNVCLGVWEKTGYRRYMEVHPDFNWDPTGKAVSIFIQRVEITVSPDGQSFSGTFTWDSYDFAGKPLAGTHSEGTATGERITVRGRFPFPFPL